MRMADEGLTAAELIAQTDERALAELIWKYGEERFSRQIARALKRQRPTTTFQAVEAVKSSVPRRAWPKELHVATRTFQALRIAVNRELDNLEAALAAIPTLLRPGGVAAIISFHSLEDRPVKHTFRQLCGEGPDDAPRGLPVISVKHAAFKALTHKPLTASAAEASLNPRARSAKLRAIEKLS
jgi:16S rRNA (cytosine1402-N4)-methyltransferase